VRVTVDQRAPSHARRATPDMQQARRARMRVVTRMGRFARSGARALEMTPENKTETGEGRQLCTR